GVLEQPAEVVQDVVSAMVAGDRLREDERHALAVGDDGVDGPHAGTGAQSGELVDDDDVGARLGCEYIGGDAVEFELQAVERSIDGLDLQTEITESREDLVVAAGADL